MKFILELDNYEQMHMHSKVIDAFAALDVLDTDLHDKCRQYEEEPKIIEGIMVARQCLFDIMEKFGLYDININHENIIGGSNELR